MNEARFGKDTINQRPAARFDESLLKLQNGIRTDPGLTSLGRRSLRRTGS
jgi:hypothetical protein